MIAVVLFINGLALALLIAGVILVSWRSSEKRDIGVLAVTCGMVLAVVGLILSVCLYQGWLPT